MSKTAAVITNGNLTALAQVREIITGTELIICVDGAAEHLKLHGIVPHVLLGDLDSVSEETRAALAKMDVAIEKYPAEKDQTDTELAMEYCARNGVRKVFLFGATGSRLDHSLANVFLFVKAKNLGLDVTLFTNTSRVQLVNQKLTIRGKPGDLFSLLPLSENVTGITLEGLKYPLQDATIELGSSLGISNELTGDTATVTVKSGNLLAVFTPSIHA